MRRGGGGGGGYPRGGIQNQQHGSAYQVRDLAEHFSQALTVSQEQPTLTDSKGVKPYIYDPMCILDIEMTDTDPRIGKIAEIAVYLVSGDLRLQIQIASFVIKLDTAADFKNDEVVKRFSKSGLWQDLQNPEKVIPLSQAEELIIKQLEEYGITASQIPSAGIQAYNDRIVLEKQMPSFNKFLNFTIIDISSVDEIASRWNKRVFNKRDSKESRLRAEPNARRAIQRLQYYKLQLFKSSSEGSESATTTGRGGHGRGQTTQSSSSSSSSQQSWWSQLYNPVLTYQEECTWEVEEDELSIATQQQQQQSQNGGGNIPAYYPGQNFQQWDRD